MTCRYIVGDVREVLRTLPDDSVDLVFTSPPFLALRSYLPADHPDKALEIGSEATPGEFLDTLLDVVEDLARVLAPHGSLVFELGDTYAGSGGAGGDYNEGGMRENAPGFKGSASRSGWHRSGVAESERPGPRYRQEGTIADSGSPNGGQGWPLSRSLCLIPQLFAMSLAYGFNPLTGRQTDRWRVRNWIAWCRPNPPVGALGDKFRPATSYLTVACKGRRWFDLDAVREPHRHLESQVQNGKRATDTGGNRADDGGTFYNIGNPAGAPPLDYWVIPTEPYPGSHYATFPARCA